MGSSQRSKKGSKKNKMSKAKKLYHSNRLKMSLSTASENDFSSVVLDHTYSVNSSNTASTSNVGLEQNIHVCNSDISNVGTTGSETTEISTNETEVDMDTAWGTNEEVERILNHPLEIEVTAEEPINIEGNRIVDLGYVLTWALKLQRNHSAVCTSGQLYLWKETRNANLPNRQSQERNLTPIWQQFGVLYPLGAVTVIFAVFKSGKSLEEAAQNNNICLEMQNGHLRLKRKHNYYYQVQGQLNVSNKNYCYFIVYVDDKTELFVEKINKDQQLWSNVMLPPLIKFYKENVVPEIIQRRAPKGLKCTNSESIKKEIQNRIK
ncbi:hypothetical protein FQR65_LT00380 [Abscondita terminalis]|nr:hypothetical protein FQR65_LT00380 [Abscondita terminalis]